jgi:hypothetical protein
MDESVRALDTGHTLDTHFELRPQAFQHAPKDFATELKHLVDRAQSVSTDGQTQVLLGCQEERRVFGRRGRRNDHIGVRKDVGMRLEDGEDEV